MAQVEMQAGPFRVVSLMAREAVDELGLDEGVVAIASIKSTHVCCWTQNGSPAAVGRWPATLSRSPLPQAIPGKVNAITDLSRATLKVVLCVATAPCGEAAAKVLSAAGVVAHVVSYENDVKATLAKVQLGEADAAIVYHSDVVSAGVRVRGVQIPASVNQTLDYPLIRLTDDPTTIEFATFLLSDQSRQRLRDNGFLTP